MRMFRFSRQLLLGTQTATRLVPDRWFQSAIAQRCALSNQESTEVTAEPTPLVETSFNSDNSVFKVPSLVSLHKFAGKLASALREDITSPVMLQATGTKPVNVAIKTIHVAGQFLRQRPGKGICFQVNHEKGADKDRAAMLRLAVSTTDLYALKDPTVKDLTEEIRCGKDVKARTMGSRLATVLNKDGKAVTVGVGPRTVGRMVVSFAWARRVLRHHGFDAIVVPFMKTMPLKKDYGKVTGMQFFFHRIPYVERPDLDPVEEFEDDPSRGVNV